MLFAVISFENMSTTTPANSTAAKRILKEYNTICADASSGFKITLVGNDMNHWETSIIGPEDTPYANGIFKLEIKFPLDYPFNPVS